MKMRRMRGWGSDMSHPYHHAESSARKYGGVPEDYLDIHQWFDASKAAMGNFRHRALRHHAFGIFECESVFGATLVNSAGKRVPVRFVAEQHVKEDCGGIIPSAQDWLRSIEAKSWMRVGRLSGDELEVSEDGVVDLSLEAWRASVSRGETVLGHHDWAERTRLMMAPKTGHERTSSGS